MYNYTELSNRLVNKSKCDKTVLVFLTWWNKLTFYLGNFSNCRLHERGNRRHDVGDMRIDRVHDLRNVLMQYVHLAIQLVLYFLFSLHCCGNLYKRRGKKKTFFIYIILITIFEDIYNLKMAFIFAQSQNRPMTEKEAKI